MKLKALEDTENVYAGEVVDAEVKVKPRLEVRYEAPRGGVITECYTIPDMMEDFDELWEIVEGEEEESPHTTLEELDKRLQNIEDHMKTQSSMNEIFFKEITKLKEDK